MPQLPAVLVLLTAGCGVALAGSGSWHVGAVVLAVALLLAAGLRLSMPTRTAGWLVVRSRGFDAAFLLTLGAALVVLAGTVPTG